MFPPSGSLFLFPLVLPPLPLFSPRERETRIVGFIVFELDASLFCFVSHAIRGANCRSYAIAFCFLLLPPFLYDPLSVSSQPSVHHHHHHLLVLLLDAPRTTNTTDHDADREGRLSHSPHSLSPHARSSTLEHIAVPMLFLSSLSRRTRLPSKRRGEPVIPSPFLSFPRREKRSVFVSRPPLHLSRSRPDRVRDWFFLSCVLGDAGPHGRKREKEHKAVTERRVKGGTF